MVSSADTGIQTWIREVFGGVLGSMSYPVFFLVIMVVALILTNLMSNVAIGIMISTVAVPFLAVFAADSGINITMFTAGLMMADMYAFATPAACGAAPLLFGQECIKNDTKFLYTKGAVVCVVHLLLLWGMFTIASYIF